MIRALAVASLALTFATVSAGAARVLSFDELDGWHGDDHGAALDVFLETCPDIDRPPWPALCAVAQTQAGGRGFFEAFFRPVLVGEPPALFTGYYEPEIPGALRRDARHRWPIYRTPPELVPGTLWHSRAEIEENGLLDGRGLEIAWLADPVDRFFLQIQGSGRIRLPDGGILRVGYAARNGHDYRSIGKELVRRGIYRPHEVSASVISAWIRRNPQEGRDLLHHNPSYVFFRRLPDMPPGKGPLGAMNRSVTALRSIAVDPAHTRLGAPVWVEKDGAEPLRRLMIAQDTGSAIKGAQRADIFYGSGPEAGRIAGRVRDRGRMVVLLPVDEALALATGPEG